MKSIINPRVKAWERVSNTILTLLGMQLHIHSELKLDHDGKIVPRGLHIP